MLTESMDYGYAMSRQRWGLTPSVVGGDSGRQSLTDLNEGGRWCLMVVMDDCCGSSGQWTTDTAFNGGGGGGVR